MKVGRSKKKFINKINSEIPRMSIVDSLVIENPASNFQGEVFNW